MDQIWGMHKPSRYRKLPIEILAQQYDADKAHRLKPPFSDVLCRCESVDWTAHIHTLEGPMSIKNGDWIVRGIHGEFYPVDNSIFQVTYEEATKSGQKQEDPINSDVPFQSGGYQ